jgi:hypothetical protein
VRRQNAGAAQQFDLDACADAIATEEDAQRVGTGCARPVQRQQGFSAEPPLTQASYGGNVTSTNLSQVHHFCVVSVLFAFPD